MVHITIARSIPKGTLKMKVSKKYKSNSEVQLRRRMEENNACSQP